MGRSMPMASRRSFFAEFAGSRDLSDLLETQAAADLVIEQVNIHSQSQGHKSVEHHSNLDASVMCNRETFFRHDMGVPATYNEYINACETFRDVGVTLVYGTYAGAWTDGSTIGSVV